MAIDQNGGFEQRCRSIRHEPFLATMKRIVPWQESCAVIEACSPTAMRQGTVHSLIRPTPAFQQ